MDFGWNFGQVFSQLKKMSRKSMMSKKPVKCENKHTTCAVYRPPFFLIFHPFFLYEKMDAKTERRMTEVKTKQ